MSEFTSARTGTAHDNDDIRIATLEAQNLNNRIATLESTIQSLQTNIDTIQQHLNNHVPYLINEYKEGIWLCRIWSDNKRECIGRYDSTFTNANAWNGGKYIYPTINFPSNFFTKAPDVSLHTAHGSDPGGMTFTCTWNSYTSSQIKIFVFDPANHQSDYSYSIHLYAIQL